jgi:putative intracellular protease/amidase/YHS domain-containing protein
MRSLSRRCSVPFALVCLAIALPRAAGREDKPSEPVALKSFDPVLLVEGKESKGKDEFSASRDGLRYVFVSAANKAKFEKDPERYAIQFQGHCAMMHEAKVDPELFTVHKGRIYGFGSEDCRDQFRQDPAKFAVAEKAEKAGGGRRKVGILVFNKMELLDFAGPAEVFAGAGYDVFTVAATKESVPSMGLVNLTPQFTFEDCPRPDIIVIPGGDTRALVNDKRVIDWLKQAQPGAEITMSVCTGAFVLGKAGLLEGKEATTHWSAISALRTRFPHTTVHDDRRIVDNGSVITTAGVSAGIDGALHVVERLSGHDKAVKTARYMEYNWQPPAEVKK